MSANSKIEATPTKSPTKQSVRLGEIHIFALRGSLPKSYACDPIVFSVQQ